MRDPVSANRISTSFHSCGSTLPGDEDTDLTADGAAECDKAEGKELEIEGAKPSVFHRRVLSSVLEKDKRGNRKK